MRVLLVGCGPLGLTFAWHLSPSCSVDVLSHGRQVHVQTIAFRRMYVEHSKRLWESPHWVCVPKEECNLILLAVRMEQLEAVCNDLWMSPLAHLPIVSLTPVLPEILQAVRSRGQSVFPVAPAMVAYRDSDDAIVYGIPGSVPTWIEDYTTSVHVDVLREFVSRLSHAGLRLDSRKNVAPFTFSTLLSLIPMLFGLHASRGDFATMLADAKLLHIGTKASKECHRLAASVGEGAPYVSMFRFATPFLLRSSLRWLMKRWPEPFLYIEKAFGQGKRAQFERLFLSVEKRATEVQIDIPWVRALYERMCAVQ